MGTQLKLADEVTKRLLTSEAEPENEHSRIFLDLREMTLQMLRDSRRGEPDPTAWASLGRAA
jgi:hypothetical protein